MKGIALLVERALALTTLAVLVIAGSCSAPTKHTVNNDAHDAGLDAHVYDARDTSVPEAAYHDASEAEAGSLCAPTGTSTWMVDPSRWKAVPEAQFTSPPCTIYEALPDSLPPPLIWQSLGPGIDFADPVQGIGKITVMSFIYPMGDKQHDECFLVLEHGDCPSRGILVQRIVRLSDGATVGALKSEDPGDPGSYETCGLGMNPGEAHVWGQVATLMTRARLSSAGTWQWATSVLPFTQFLTGLPVMVEYHGLTEIGFGAGVTWMMDDPTSNTYKILENPSTGYGIAAARGDLALWVTSPGNGVRGWAPDGKGVRDVIAGVAGTTLRLGLSWDRIVGVEGDADDYFVTRARFWTSPRGYDTNETSVAFGPDVLKGAFYPGFPATSGDFAVISVADLADGSAGYSYPGYLIVVRLTDFKAWRLDPREGRDWNLDSYGLSHSWLYATDRYLSDGSERYARTVYRYDISKIDVWGKAL